MRTLVYVLFAWLLALSVITALSFYEISASRSAARADGRAVWRAVVCTIESNELKSKRLTPTQRTQAVQFWTTLLVDRIGTKSCSTTP